MNWLKMNEKEYFRKLTEEKLIKETLTFSEMNKIRNESAVIIRKIREKI